LEYSGINLTKNTQDLSNENFKMLLRVIKDYLNKWRAIASTYGGSLLMLWY
jgi:hypothetical protein